MTSLHRVPKEARSSRWTDATEYELVRLVQGGNSSAFEELMRRTNELCMRVAVCILGRGRREDARDEVQSAYWLAYSRLSSFTYQAKFSTWLTRIVINRCFMSLRKSRAMPVFTENIITENGETYVFEGVTRETPESDLGQTEVYCTLRRELSGIPPLLRVPIELHYIRELPVRDVAKELGISVAATKSRLHRAQQYLRARMLRHCGRRGPAILTNC
jgi:RNA polymerase sigma-70 factor, ECF subfamily